MSNTNTRADESIRNYNKYFRAITCQDPAYTEKNEDNNDLKIYDDMNSFVLGKFNIDAATFKINMNEFLDNSVKLSDLEKLNTTSGKLSGMQNDKLQDLKKTLNGLHNSQFNSIREYQSKIYAQNETAFLKHIFIVVLVLLSAIFILASLSESKVISSMQLLQLSLALGLVAVIYIALNIKNNIYRKNYDWNKYYFQFNKPAQEV